MRCKTLLPFYMFCFLIIAACTSEPQNVVQIPTLAVLPSVTPLSIDTFIPSPTWTSDTLGTQISVGNLTNEVAQATLAAMWTQAVVSPTPSLTITPTKTAFPTATASTTPLPTRTAAQTSGCNANEVMLWMAELERISTRETPDEVEDIQQMYSELAALSYPQCAQPARAALLSAFDELVQAYEAASRNDYNAIAIHQVNGEQELGEFSRLSDQLITMASYNNQASAQYQRDSSGNIQFDVLCADGTLERVWTRQGACGNHGGLWDDAHPYVGSGGGIICNDGTVSSASNRQGACSHHGGISN